MNFPKNVIRASRGQRNNDRVYSEDVFGTKLIHHPVIMLALGFGLICCLGCKSPLSDFDKDVGRFFGRHCQGTSPCIFQITDVTSFSWDKMYAFRYGVSQDEAESVIGRPIPDFVQLTRKVIFTKDGNVVYVSQQPGRSERTIPHEVMFQISPMSNYVIYTPETSFYLTRGELADLTYYIPVVR